MDSIFIVGIFIASSLFLLASGEAVDGRWGPWQLGRCSVTCGEGLRPRYRECNDPMPSGGGKKCLGAALENLPCLMPACPVDGGWNDWSAWSPCSGSCGIGVRRRTRSCKAPSPMNGGEGCQGPGEETQPCHSDLVQPCPVSGGWSDWYPFLPCPADIGEVCHNPTKHQRVRQRFCTNPEPAFGGSDCQGNDFEYKKCSELYACADGGQWSAWQNGTCSVTCGIGLEKVTRTCLDEPLGRNCSGPSELIRDCKMPKCRVDGGWSPWHETKPCPVAHVEDPCASQGLLSDDFRIIERTCTNPAPSDGGAYCVGDALRVEKCREMYGCPDLVTASAALWSDWQMDGPCGVTCGKGLQRRVRKCLSSKDEDCGGPVEEVITCQMPPCPTTTPFNSNTNALYTITVDDTSKQSTREAEKLTNYGFSQWTEWSACDTTTCKQTRWRLCQLKNGGCYGNDVEKRTCVTPADACSAAALHLSSHSSATLPSQLTGHQTIIFFVIITSLTTSVNVFPA